MGCHSHLLVVLVVAQVVAVPVVLVAELVTVAELVQLAQVSASVLESGSAWV